MTPLDHGLKAKQVFHELNLTYPQIAAGAKVPGLKSRAGISNLVNRNIWPITTPREVVEEKLEQFLRQKGATDKQLEGIWEFSRSLSIKKRSELPNGNGKNHGPKKINRMGVRMIDRECMTHFGLQKSPFPKRISSKGDMLMLRPFKRVFDQVQKAIEDREFACVVGESGSGKTTLRIMIEEHFKKNPNVQFVAPLDLERESMKPNSLAVAICRDLNPGLRSIPNRREQLYRLARNSLMATLSPVLVSTPR